MLISTGYFCTVYNIINSKILDIDTHTQHFANISDTSTSMFIIERCSMCFICFHKKVLTFYLFMESTFLTFSLNLYMQPYIFVGRLLSLASR